MSIDEYKVFANRLTWGKIINGYWLIGNEWQRCGVIYHNPEPNAPIAKIGDRKMKVKDFADLLKSECFSHSLPNPPDHVYEELRY